MLSVDTGTTPTASIGTMVLPDLKQLSDSVVPVDVAGFEVGACVGG